MNHPLFYLAIAFIGSFTMIVFLHPFAQRVGLTDKPDHRKVHSGEIPLIGGISIYLGVLLSSLIMLSLPSEHSVQLTTYLLASLLMVVTGAIDDRFNLGVKIRILVQIIIASIMMFVANDWITNLGDLLSLGEWQLGYFGYPFTIIAVLAAINAYNMVDGIDGLIGGVSFSSFSTLAVLFYLSGDFQESFFCALLLVALIPYLLHNLQLTKFSSKKIFMGDAGSMFIGFSVVWLLAIGSQKHASGVDLSISSFKPVVALWVIAIPLIDMASVMIRRIRKGVSPFAADRDHLHHIFMRAGFSPRATLVFITLGSLFFGLIGILATFYSVPEWQQIVFFLVLFFSYNKSLSKIWLLFKFYNGMKREERFTKKIS